MVFFLVLIDFVVEIFLGPEIPLEWSHWHTHIKQDGHIGLLHTSCFYTRFSSAPHLFHERNTLLALFQHAITTSFVLVPKKWPEMSWTWCSYGWILPNSLPLPREKKTLLMNPNWHIHKSQKIAGLQHHEIFLRAKFTLKKKTTFPHCYGLKNSSLQRWGTPKDRSPICRYKLFLQSNFKPLPHRLSLPTIRSPNDLNLIRLVRELWWGWGLEALQAKSWNWNLTRIENISNPSHL